MYGSTRSTPDVLSGIPESHASQHFSLLVTNPYRTQVHKSASSDVYDLLGQFVASLIWMVGGTNKTN